MALIYLLAKSLGTSRPDGSDSLLPVSRTPMGLLEYMVNFFTASSTNIVLFKKLCNVIRTSKNLLLIINTGINWFS